MQYSDQQQGLSVKEYAHRVGIGLTRLYIEIRLGRVKVLKSGSRTIIPISEVEAFFQRLEAAQVGKEGGR